MAQYDTILATKYNSIRNKVNQIIDTDGNYGYYGGTPTTTAVKGPSAGTSPPDIISEAQWDQLRADITRCYRHQNGISPTITDIYQGLTIYWAHAVQYDVLADGLITNKNTVYTGATTGGYTQQVEIVTGDLVAQTGNWNTSKYAQFTATFDTVSHINEFFNLGGWIRPYITQPSQTYTAGTKAKGWSDLLYAANRDLVPLSKATLNSGNPIDQTFYDDLNPYKENNIVVSYVFTNNQTVRCRVTFNDADVGDTPQPPAAGAGPAVDENVGVDISVDWAYRKSIGEFISSIPTMSAVTWT